MEDQNRAHEVDEEVAGSVVEEVEDAAIEATTIAAATANSSWSRLDVSPEAVSKKDASLAEYRQLVQNLAKKARSEPCMWLAHA